VVDCDLLGGQAEPNEVDSTTLDRDPTGFFGKNCLVSRAHDCGVYSTNQVPLSSQDAAPDFTGVL
jgi:hypothetical protein